MLKEYRRIKGSENRAIFFNKLSYKLAVELRNSLNQNECNELERALTRFRQKRKLNTTPSKDELKNLEISKKAFCNTKCLSCLHCTFELPEDLDTCTYIERTCKIDSTPIKNSKCRYPELYAEKIINRTAVVEPTTITYFQTQQ